ncbi:MAG: hypothetical protein D6776_01530 [Planctomycetota bacterium]|nr:MAG: hypothetical protein D6776_01530 [Planctomycetota bacterium]
MERFAQSADALAVALDADALPGVFGKRLVVPEGCVAWIEPEDAAARLAAPGDSVRGRFEAVLVKRADVALSFEFSGLAAADGHEVTAGLQLVLRLPRTEVAIRQLAATLLREQPALDHDRLRAYLAPAVRAALARHVAARALEPLMESDPRAALDEAIRAESEALLFDAGLELLELRLPSFYSEAFEAIRAARAAAELEAHRLAEQQRVQEMRARLERNERLKREEIEAFARRLRYQGVLEELELREQLDRKRFEQQVQRFEALYEKLGRDETKALIFLLDDEQLKAQLLRELIRRDMTPEQLAALRAEELERRVAERLAAFGAHAAEREGQRAQRVARSGMRTRRLLVAFGKQVLAFEPSAGERCERERYDFSGGPLGWVRSVRVVATRRGPAVVAGAQRGIYVVLDGETEPRALTLPREPRGRGGVNAAAAFGGYLYATHSELGLTRWDEYGLERPEPLFEAVTARNEATRGVQVSADGRLYFSSGPDIYRCDLVRPSHELVRFHGREGSITGFVLSEHEVFAGTGEGRVLRWSIDDPGSPRELNVRKGGPIYMLRLAEIDGAPHLLVGAKEHGITAVSLEQGRAFDYRAPEAIRWVDGATDFVYGVSRDGRAVHVWDADRLGEPRFVLRVPERIQDVWVQKEPMVREGPAC